MDGTAAQRLFDDNAATYDWVNTLVSLGLDSRWRAWAASSAAARGDRVLDAYCGTGLVGLGAAYRGAHVTFADVSPAMLAIAAGRCVRRRLDASFVLADLASGELPLRPASFDAITVVFGLRYMDDAPAQLHRLARLLVPGGRLVLVEFVPPSRPQGRRPPLSQILASTYFFGVLPRLASGLAGSSELYDYLNASTREVGGADRIDALLRGAGLRVWRRRRMGFGLVYGVVAVP